MIRRAILLGANGVLLAGTLWAFFAPLSLPEVPRNAKPALTAPVEKPAFPEVDAAAIPVRSLFRPMPPPPAPPQPPPMPVMAPPPQPVAPTLPPETPMRLVGLIHRIDEVAAFIEIGGSREIVRHVVGEAVEGWTITQIRRREIVLVKAGQDNARQVRILPLDPLKAP